MLHSLYVKNLALIDETEITFTKGLNILTGETGAGKSILIGSVNLALGEKADASLIRDGADYALIEMVFGVEDERLRDELKRMDIVPDDETGLILQRRILPGRSVCKVSGETVSLKQLRELAALLINIHGQNDQHALLTRSSQTELLDHYAGEAARKEKEALRMSFRAYQEIEKELSAYSPDASRREREADLIRYEINEIDEAALTEGEDEKLEAAYKRMSLSQKITDALTAAQRMVAGDEESALSFTAAAYKQTASVLQADETLSDLADQLRDAESLLSDVSHGIDDYLRGFSFDEHELEEIAGRLNLINRLKEKYDAKRGGIASILAYRRAREEELEKLEDFGKYRENKQKEADAHLQKALACAKRLSDIRKKCAKKLSAQLSEALRDLNFTDARFAIDVADDPDNLHAGGFDTVTFLIAPNPGEKPRPLAKIASGGELSRIMLGIKTVVTKGDDHLAMIFDEIDAGISGKTAWKVSEKLGRLGRDRQVICITHLPQIAAMADTHFYIYKELTDGRNVTRIRKLGADEAVSETARLIGTDAVSKAALQSAREMRMQAKTFKEKDGQTDG